MAADLLPGNIVNDMKWKKVGKTRKLQSSGDRLPPLGKSTDECVEWCLCWWTDHQGNQGFQRREACLTPPFIICVYINLHIYSLHISSLSNVLKGGKSRPVRHLLPPPLLLLLSNLPLPDLHLLSFSAHNNSPGNHLTSPLFAEFLKTILHMPCNYSLCPTPQ